MKDLIIELSLSMPIVQRQGFFKFMNQVDPKFTMINTSFESMNGPLEIFCSQTNPHHYTELISGQAFVSGSLKFFVLSFLPIHHSHTRSRMIMHLTI